MLLSPSWGLLHLWAKKSLMGLTAGMKAELSISPQSLINFASLLEGPFIFSTYIHTYSEITR